MITPRRLFIGIILLYLAVFGAFLFAESRLGDLDEIPSASFPVHGPDSLGYAALANNLADHGVFSESRVAPYTPDTFRTPGYPFFVYFFSRVIPGGLFLVVALQIILAALSALLIWEIGKRLGYPKAGLAASFLFVLEPTVIFSVLTIMSETLFMCILLSAFFLHFWGSEFLSSQRKSIAVGILVGLAILVRPIGVFLPLFFIVGQALFIKKPDTRSFLVGSFIFSATVALVVAPWILRNKSVSGVYGLSALSSYNLAMSDVPYFLAYKMGISREDAVKIIHEESGSLSEAQKYSLSYSDQLGDVAWSYIKKDPLGYLAYHGVTMSSFFAASSLRTIANNIHDEKLHTFFGLDTPGPGVFGLLSSGDWKGLKDALLSQGLFTLERVLWIGLAILALFGVWALGRSGARMSVLFLGMIFMWAFLTGPVFTPRYRIPAEPFLFLLSAIGFQAFSAACERFWRSRRLL